MLQIFVLSLQCQTIKSNKTMEQNVYVLTETLVANNYNLIYQKTFLFNGYTDELKARIKDILDNAKDSNLHVEVDDNPQWTPLLDTTEANEVEALPIKVITTRNPIYDDEPIYHATLTKTAIH